MTLTREALMEAMAGPNAIGYTLPPETALIVAGEALAALEALFKQHGLKVLPEEASEEMLKLGWPPSHDERAVSARRATTWQAMHRAAPWWPWEGGDA